MIPREFHHISTVDKPDKGDSFDTDEDVIERSKSVPENEANVVSSMIFAQDPDVDVFQSMHAPVIDIDFPAALIPSSTPGHFHLYLEKPVPWPMYSELLNVLADCGLIERGYANASIARGRTFVRKPMCPKPPPAEEAEESA